MQDPHHSFSIVKSNRSRTWRAEGLAHAKWADTEPQRRSRPRSGLSVRID
jgi:hypothetical protein